METEVSIEIQEDSGLWYIYVLGRRVGAGSADKRTIEALQRWMRPAVHDMMNVYVDLLDKAFKENKERS